jgi:carboxyl-terminal processing protease
MRQIIFILFFLNLSSIVINGQVSVQVDSIYSFIKRNSIHRNNVNWEIIDKGFKKKLSLAKTDIDSIKGFIYVFDQLKDFHSSITFNGRQFSNYPEFDDSTLKYLIPLVNLSNQRTGIFTARILPENFLYLQVPGVQAWGNNVNVFAQKLSDSLCKYMSAATRGIVLDLRLNDGGQFTSMASGLSLLLGENYIGGGVNIELKRLNKFSIKKKNLWINQNQMTTVIHKNNINLSKLPVAILIGPNTRSSGSILAISFKGRKNTILIGDSTANGYTTGNEYFSFGSDLFLNLSTSFSIDRNKKVYKLSVPPDIFIRGEDDFINIENDKKVKVALKWLTRNSYQTTKSSLAAKHRQ